MSRQDTELPEGYKMTELGPLPEEWRVVRLGEVVRPIKGKKPPRLFKEYQGRAISYLTAEYFRSGLAVHFVPYDDCQNLPTCSREDLVLIWDGSNAGQIFTGLEGVLASTMVRLDLLDLTIDRQFLYFYLLTQFEFLNSQTTGSTIPHVNKNAFRSLPIPLPPLAEQRAIAHVLRTVQEAKQTTERVIAALRELKKSLMRHLFTYGPVPLDQAVQVPVKDTGAGPVPEHWNLVTISETCRVRGSSISLSELHSLDTRDEADALVHGIKVADMNLTGNELWILRANLQVRLPEVVAQKKAIPANSIVFPKRGAAIATNKKRMTSTWTVLDPNLIAVIPGPRINPIFLFYWFQTFDLTELQAPGPTPQLNKKDIDPILFPLPPTSEQQEITSILQAVDRRIQAEENYARALEALFKTLLHHLMTSKVRVNSLSFAQGG